MIEDQIAGQYPGELRAGHKKDVVITNLLSERPKRVAIYGWHFPSSEPIQPLTTVHVDWYVDYSHGILRLSGPRDDQGGWSRHAPSAGVARSEAAQAAEQ